jgi:hypothetical protein
MYAAEASNERGHEAVHVGFHHDICALSSSERVAPQEASVGHALSLNLGHRRRCVWCSNHTRTFAPSKCLQPKREYDTGGTQVVFTIRAVEYASRGCHVCGARDLTRRYQVVAVQFLGSTFISYYSLR